jgi:signal transduction histidine kinase
MHIHYTGFFSNRRVWLIVVAAGALTVLLFSSVVALTYRARVQGRRRQIFTEELPHVIHSVDEALRSYLATVSAGLGLLATRDGWRERLAEFAADPDLAKTATTEWAAHLGTDSVDVADIQREVVYGYWADEPIRLEPESERDAWFYEVWTQPDPPETKITFYYDSAIGGHAFYIDQLLRDEAGVPIGTLGVLRLLEPLARRLNAEMVADGHVYIVDDRQNVILEVSNSSYTSFGPHYGMEGGTQEPDSGPQDATAVPYETIVATREQDSVQFTPDGRYATGATRLPVEDLSARVFLDARARLASIRRAATAQMITLLASFSLFFGIFVVLVTWLIRGIHFQAELADRSRTQLDDLLSVLTHNLSNQLHPLRRHMTDMKAEQTRGMLANGLVDGVDSILLDMEQVLQNAIYSARLTNQQVRPLERVLDVDALLRRITASCGPVAEGKEQQLLIVNRSTYEVGTDEDLLFHLLLNLASNATKFSPRGAAVLVAAVDTQSTLDIVIADQGPGFKESDRPYLFEKNRRLSARPTAGERSTGMGLFVTRHLADTLGLELELRDSIPPGLADVTGASDFSGAVWAVRIPAHVTIV